ncbi:phosphoglucosamine mutase [Porticoccus hydrocarbonoclasticus]|jgi:phosphoglucosamine mutase|uniref:phosphoglucosamine mutase n=1 Tax=Porticoccus hydrocarbonoclasticus TaxID=1073414 RepID=UPI00055C511F|nr:phosphoglucosamine mutase [Porticoccus hydrocarbonoclasticus]
MARMYFGTDGIRGRVGVHPITADFVLKLGWAAGKVFSSQAGGRKLIVMGKDTRVSGYMFESALQAGLIAAGVDVALLGPMPTPAIAYLTRTFRAQAGIVISASHNPYYDNGIKFFGGDGFKLPDEVELAIESYMDKPLVTEDSLKLGKAHRVPDAVGRYIEFCKGTLPSGSDFQGLKIVVDCANGATYHTGPSVFRELGAEVVEMAVDPDGFNINEDCGSTRPALLQDAVISEKADMGIAFDGDGDRVMFVDHKGHMVDGDELLFVIAKHRHQRGECSGVAGTLMSNLGMELSLKELGIPFYRANVGDRYVIEAMRERKWQLGGESSGHIICSDLTTTGDGVVAALQVLHAMRDTDTPLNALKKGMQKYPQKMINVRIKKKFNLEDFPAIQQAVVAAESELAERGRVLLRPSGTEPLVRVMVEGEDDQQVNTLVKQIAAVVEKEIG